MDTRRSFKIVNELVASYIDSMYVNPNPKLEELRAFAFQEHVPIILKDAESFLSLMLKIKNPEHILEIGTAIGYSSSCFANASNADIYTIESSQEMVDAARVNIKNLGFEDRIQILPGDAKEQLEAMECIDFYDMVFIDAAKSHYKEFWELIIPMCRDNAMIICDNILMKGMTAADEFDTRKRYKTSIRKMRDFLDYINNLDYAETSILPIGDGISISVISK